MNREWSEQNKLMQLQIKKKDTFLSGIDTLMEHRKELMEQIQIEELYHYLFEVEQSTTEILKALTYDECKKKISDEKRHTLEALQVVSKDENAYWLIDYWCKKDVRGLIQMPFSRHWIMHIEACLKIKDKLVKP